MASLPAAEQTTRAQPWSQRGRKGFTLIELVVAVTLLALLAGASAPLAMHQIRTSRLRTTQDRMQDIVVAMIGDRESGSHGYLGDMGALPAALIDLNTLGTQAPATSNPDDGISTGWAGPYVPLAGANGSAFIDAWGNPFAYAPGTAQITSNGPDGQPATGDELVYPADPPRQSGGITVVLEGVANDGNVCSLDGSQANVRVYTSIDGVRTPLDFVSNGAGTFVNDDLVPPFPDPDELHNGAHGIEATGVGNWAAATTVRSVASVDRTSTVVRLRLYQPSGPPVGCP